MSTPETQIDAQQVVERFTLKAFVESCLVLEQGEAVQLETRGPIAIAWLNRPPANSISPEVIQELSRIWEHVEGSEEIRALVIASSNPMLFSAGADIKAFTKMDEAAGKELLDQ